MPTSDRVPALPSPVRHHRARAGTGLSLAALAAATALLSSVPADAASRTGAETTPPAATRSSAETVRLAQLAKTTWRIHTFDALQVQTPPDWIERASADARTFTVSGNGANAPALTLSTAGMAADPNGIAGMIAASRARMAGLAATRYDWRKDGRRGVMLVLEEPAPTGEPLTLTFTTPNEDWVAMRPIFERALHSIRYTVKAPAIAMPARPRDSGEAAGTDTAKAADTLPPASQTEPEAAATGEETAPTNGEGTAGTSAEASPAGISPAETASGDSTPATTETRKAEATNTVQSSPLFPTAPAAAVPSEKSAPAAEPTETEAGRTQPPEAAEATAPTDIATPETATAAPPTSNAPAIAAPQKARAEEAPARSTADGARETIADLGWRLRVPADWELVEESRYGVSSWKLRRKGWRAGDGADGLFALTVTLTADAGSAPLDAVVDDAVAQLSHAAFAGETETIRSAAALGGTEGRLVDIRPSGTGTVPTKRLRLFLARNGDRLVIVTALARSASGGELDRAFGPGGLITTALKKTSRLESGTAE